MLTISKLKRWSINYYIDTAAAAEHAARDLARAGGGLGEYYSERETRTPVWLLAGDAHKVAPLVGLADVEREVADTLNQRLHRDTVGAAAPTVSGARGHPIAVGDLIISRQNDTSIPLRNANDPAAEQNPVRNGNRWRVTAINAEDNRLAARRLDDNTVAVLDNDYLREHITHGYAVTVHSAQGVTADTTHAVLGENTTRAMLYVAMTRGREINNAYIYERATEQEYGQLHGAHVMDRRNSDHAGRLLRAIIANHDQPVTAHDIAAQAPGAALPERVRSIRDRRAAAVQRRRPTHQVWQADWQSFARTMTKAQERHSSRSRDHSLDYGIEM